MRDYAELVKALRGFDVGESCPCETPEMCEGKDCMVIQAADAIEELVAAVLDREEQIGRLQDTVLYRDIQIKKLFTKDLLEKAHEEFIKEASKNRAVKYEQEVKSLRDVAIALRDEAREIKNGNVPFPELPDPPKEVV